MTTSLASKRDVREYIKTTLQPLVDDGTIENEELREAVKAGGDAVSTLPASTTAAERVGYRALLDLLTAAAATEAVLTRVRMLLSGCDRLPAEPAAAPSTATDTAGTTSATLAGEGAAEKPALTFGAFRARMARKKEELQAAASARPEAAPTTANTTAPPTAAASVTASAQPSSSASLRASPAMRPESGPTPPPATVTLPVSLTTANDASEGSSSAAAPTSSAPAPVQPPQVSAAPTIPQLTLTPTPVEEVDLYGDIYRGRGRARNAEATATRGGRGAWGGRGGGFGGPPPGATDAYGPPRGGYRGGRGYGAHVSYQGSTPPPRGRYPHPPYARGGPFRPY